MQQRLSCLSQRADNIKRTDALQVGNVDAFKNRMRCCAFCDRDGYFGTDSVMVRVIAAEDICVECLPRNESLWRLSSSQSECMTGCANSNDRFAAFDVLANDRH